MPVNPKKGLLDPRSEVDEGPLGNRLDARLLTASRSKLLRDKCRDFGSPRRATTDRRLISKVSKHLFSSPDNHLISGIHIKVGNSTS